MSVTSGRHGGRVVMEKRSPLQDRKLKQNVDRLMYQEYCSGKEIPEVAKMFKCSTSWVYRRFKRMPGALQKEFREDATVVRNARLRHIARKMEASPGAR